MPSATGFGQQLRKLREAKGWTQGGLAERAGLNQFGVAKIEQGLREPNWTTVLALAKALGVTTEAFTVTGKPPAPAKRPRGRPAATEKPAPKRKRGD